MKTFCLQLRLSEERKGFSEKEVAGHLDVPVGAETTTRTIGIELSVEAASSRSGELRQWRPVVHRLRFCLSRTRLPQIAPRRTPPLARAPLPAFLTPSGFSRSCRKVKPKRACSVEAESDGAFFHFSDTTVSLPPTTRATRTGSPLCTFISSPWPWTDRNCHTRRLDWNEQTCRRRVAGCHLLLPRSIEGALANIILAVSCRVSSGSPSSTPHHPPQTTCSAYLNVPGTDVSSEWLEGRLSEFVASLCAEWTTALPLVQARAFKYLIHRWHLDGHPRSLPPSHGQVWLPKKSTGTLSSSVFLSTEDCPYQVSDPAMTAFRKRRFVGIDKPIPPGTGSDEPRVAPRRAPSHSVGVCRCSAGPSLLDALTVLSESAWRRRA